MGTSRERAGNTVGGRAVLNEAIQVAIADLASVGEFAPIVVTKDWGDCQVERLGDEELQRTRTRMHDLLSGREGSGHCALAHLEQVGGDSPAIVIQVGRMGGEEVDLFVQRYRPRRGRFRPFKLIGTPVRRPEAKAGDSAVPQPSMVPGDAGDGDR